MKKYIKNIIILLAYLLGIKEKNENLHIKSIKLLTPYILHIDFTKNSENYYLIIHGDYKEIRTKHLQRNSKSEIISFDEFMEEINLLIPAKDIVKENYKKWKKKQ